MAFANINPVSDQLAMKRPVRWYRRRAFAAEAMQAEWVERFGASDNKVLMLDAAVPEVVGGYGAPEREHNNVQSPRARDSFENQQWTNLLVLPAFDPQRLPQAEMECPAKSDTRFARDDSREQERAELITLDAGAGRASDYNPEHEYPALPNADERRRELAARIAEVIGEWTALVIVPPFDPRNSAPEMAGEAAPRPGPMPAWMGAWIEDAVRQIEAAAVFRARFQGRAPSEERGGAADAGRSKSGQAPPKDDSGSTI